MPAAAADTIDMKKGEPLTSIHGEAAQHQPSGFIHINLDDWTKASQPHDERPFFQFQ